jgi:hypothetical protein
MARMSPSCDRPTITTLAEAPELEPALWSLTSVWPAFMVEDPVGDLYFADFARVHAEYVLLPADPWLRTHVRVGGRVLQVCPRSMVVPGTLAEWRDWTGLPFDTSGAVVVPGALVPVHCSVEQNHAVYVEPNVWVEHDLTVAA